MRVRYKKRTIGICSECTLKAESQIDLIDILIFSHLKKRQNKTVYFSNVLFKTTYTTLTPIQRRSSSFYILEGFYKNNNNNQFSISFETLSFSSLEEKNLYFFRSRSFSIYFYNPPPEQKTTTTTRKTQFCALFFVVVHCLLVSFVFESK